MVKVRNEEEAKVFISLLQHLNGCRFDGKLATMFRMLSLGLRTMTPMYQDSPWVPRPRIEVPSVSFLKIGDIALCNLTPASFCILTCFELLNKWYGAKLGIPEFHMLYTMRKSFDPHYFQLHRSVRWAAYTINLPRHDKDLTVIMMSQTSVNVVHN